VYQRSSELIQGVQDKIAEAVDGIYARLARPRHQSLDREAFILACQEAHWSPGPLPLKPDVKRTPSPLSKSPITHLHPKLEYLPGAGLGVHFDGDKIG